MKEPYNDIRMWNYKALPSVFGGDHVEIHDVNTSEELMHAFESIKSNNDCMRFVEVKMDVKDAPAKLNNIAKAFASQNK